MLRIEKIYRFFHRSFIHPSLTFGKVISAIFLVLIGFSLVQVYLLSIYKVPKVLFIGDLTLSSNTRFYGYLTYSFNRIDVRNTLPKDISSYTLVCLLDGTQSDCNDQLNHFVVQGGSLILSPIQILYLRQNSSSLALPSWLGFGNYTNGGFGTAVTQNDNVLDSHLPDQTILYENALNNWTASVIDLIPEPETSITILSKWINSTRNTTGPVFSYAKVWHKTNGRLLYYGGDGWDPDYGNTSIWKNLDKFLVAGIRWCARLQENSADSSSRELSKNKPSLFVGGLGAIQESHPGNYCQIDIHLPADSLTSRLKNIQFSTELRSSQASKPLQVGFYLSSTPITLFWSYEHVHTGEWNFTSQIGCLGYHNVKFNGSILQFDISLLWVTGEIEETLYLIIENQNEYDILIESFQVQCSEYHEKQS